MVRAQAEIPMQNQGLFFVLPLAFFLLALGTRVLGMVGGFGDTSGRRERWGDEELMLLLLFYVLLACL